MFQEDFLHHVWKFKLFNTDNLRTSDGQEIKIIESGRHNTDAGPDFFNSRIHIGETDWAGNVEVHRRSSDWYKHHHELDKSYQNVILHVVYDHDKSVVNKGGQEVPTLELKNLLDQKIIDNYHALIDSKDWIPCGKQIKNINPFVIENWAERLVIERLKRKTVEMKEILKRNKNNWEATFYECLFKYFGLKVNALPFLLLAQRTPLKIIDKHRQVLSIEALLYGQAGFLEETFPEDYHRRLKKEYLFLRAKFSLKPIDKTLWKFLRLRPANFPTVRISQLARLLFQNSRLFSKVIEADNVKEIQKMFQVSASEYWNTHYRFEVESGNSREKKMGITTINNLIINVVIPIVFLYSKSIKNEKLMTKALMLLEETKPETNAIIKNWVKLGVKPYNACHTQGLLELKNNYCSEKKCLNCVVGNSLLKN